ncbi:hypothetical protein THAOC_07578, partial [Thalassiosira oceanica]
VEGGHGPTQWTRRRAESTRPSRIDPVVAPNTARVSEKVTQEKSSSEVTFFINGSETSAGRARAMMHKFAVAPARLIDNGGHRAIGIALRPQHFKGDVLGMNIGAMGAVIGAPGEAMEELDSPYHRCCVVVPAEPTGCSVTANYRHEDIAQGGKKENFLKALLVLMQDLLSASPLGDIVMPIFGCMADLALYDRHVRGGRGPGRGSGALAVEKD